jgi:hypothetical protein
MKDTMDLDGMTFYLNESLCAYFDVKYSSGTQDLVVATDKLLLKLPMESYEQYRKVLEETQAILVCRGFGFGWFAVTEVREP